VESAVYAVVYLFCRDGVLYNSAGDDGASLRATVEVGKTIYHYIN